MLHPSVTTLDAYRTGWDPFGSLETHGALFMLLWWQHLIHFQSFLLCGKQEGFRLFNGGRFVPASRFYSATLPIKPEDLPNQIGFN